MNRILRTLAIVMAVAGAGIVLGGCESIQAIKAPANPPPPEPVRKFTVLTYPLPFVYDGKQPRQQAFLSVLKHTVAPADWEEGPDSMTPIAHILVVSTTAENHLRLKRFFDSLPERPEGDPDVWLGGPVYEEPKGKQTAPPQQTP